MPIAVKFFSSFRGVTGINQTSVPAAKDVRSLLEILVQKFGSEFAAQLYEPQTSELRSSVIILVNGNSIKTIKGLDTPLSSGDVVTTDTVALLEAVGGG